MKNTSVVYARIDSDLKESAESILHQLGISPSSAIQMFYRQIILTKGLPLDLHLSYNEPVNISGMSPEKLNEELAKGCSSAQTGELYSPDEVDQILKDKFHI